MTEISVEEPQFICNTVRSCKQKYYWDCGVTCVLAVIDDDSYSYFSKNFQSVCKEEKFNKRHSWRSTQYTSRPPVVSEEALSYIQQCEMVITRISSTWTIDLCYLLKRFGVKHLYYTKTVGINPDYREHDFYHRIISKDSERVLERFKSAKMNGITIIQQEIDMYHVIRHVYLHGPVILLTDANTLTCDDCKMMKFSPGDFKCFSNSSKVYHGHFVIVVGYDINEHKVFYRNPCFKQRICKTSIRSLDSAWKHEGTDQDAIFIQHYNMESS